MSEDGMCEDCNCFYEKQEFIVTDLYNYNARPQRSYPVQGGPGAISGAGRQANSPEILHQIKFELPIFSEVTAVQVKKAMRTLKLTKYIENFYYILFALTGKHHRT